jgi:hypothetical protein
MSRVFNVEEKHHLLANLAIEVNHRNAQFNSWLNDHLENFAIHQEGLVSRIPKQVRAMKMRDFGAKYNGNIQAALRGVQRDKFVAAGATEIDKSTRKRKWVASQEEHDAQGDSQKAQKNGWSCCFVLERAGSTYLAARLTVSPQKKPGSSTGPGTAQRARILAAAGGKNTNVVCFLSLPSDRHLTPPSRRVWVPRALTNSGPRSIPTPQPKAPVLFPELRSRPRNSNKQPIPLVPASLPSSTLILWYQRHLATRAVAPCASLVRTKAC